MIEVWNNILKEKELENFNNAVTARHILEGPVLKEFEELIKNILNVKYVIGTSSGSAALALAFMGIGVKPGDEVIVPDLTFIATANAAHLLGADVIPVPVKKGKTLIDADCIDRYITDKTKAIVTVDLNGRIACSDDLRKKYQKRGIYIIDDACQAFMSYDEEGMPAGVNADISCYSFGITKTLTTVMGGLAATNNLKLYEKMNVMKTQGMACVFESKDYLYPGFNFKLPDVLAAIGIAQLERLEKKINHMKEIDNLYRNELSNLEGISFFRKKKGELLWMTDIICDDKEKVREVLASNGISSRPLGMPLHTAHFMKSKSKEEYQTSEMIQNKILYLPSGPDQDLNNVEYVIKILKKNF